MTSTVVVGQELARQLMSGEVTWLVSVEPILRPDVTIVSRSCDWWNDVARKCPPCDAGGLECGTIHGVLVLGEGVPVVWDADEAYMRRNLTKCLYVSKAGSVRLVDHAEQSDTWITEAIGPQPIEPGCIAYRCQPKEHA